MTDPIAKIRSAASDLEDPISRLRNCAEALWAVAVSEQLSKEAVVYLARSMTSDTQDLHEDWNVLLLAVAEAESKAEPPDPEPKPSSNGLHVVEGGVQP